MHQPAKTVGELLAECLSQQDIVHQVRLPTIPLSRVTAGDPTFALQRRAPSWDQRMKVRMMVQFLVSRVQYHQGRRMELACLSEYLVE